MTGMFGAEWRKAMDEAREAYADAVTVRQDANERMATTHDPLETSRALGDMNQAMTTAHKKWVEANPIRWARTHGDQQLSAHALAPLVNLSFPTIYTWEQGSVINPDEEGMKRIEALFGDHNMRAYWREWRDIPATVGAE